MIGYSVFVWIMYLTAVTQWLQLVYAGTLSMANLYPNGLHNGICPFM